MEGGAERNRPGAPCRRVPSPEACSGAAAGVWLSSGSLRVELTCQVWVVGVLSQGWVPLSGPRHPEAVRV